MKAAGYKKYGTLSVVVLEDVPLPSLKADEVLALSLLCSIAAS